MGEEGLEPPNNETTGKDSGTVIINEVCAELGIKRYEAGIMAGEMAHMYFRGQRSSVGLDNIRSLSHNGTHILLIEKEGIAEQFRDLAGPYGIAIIHGRGFMTEYASELSIYVVKMEQIFLS